MKRAEKVQGIVIKRRNSGEADRILTLFTKEHGKIQVKASHVRKITSRRAPHIELFNHGYFYLQKGYVLPILTEVLIIENFSLLKESLKKIGYAYHICELVDALSAESQENIDVFFLLARTLKEISSSAGFNFLSDQFEITLLSSLGFWPRSIKASSDIHGFIESILERRLRSKRILPLFQ